MDVDETLEQQADTSRPETVPDESWPSTPLKVVEEPVVVVSVMRGSLLHVAKKSKVRPPVARDRVSSPSTVVVSDSSAPVNEAVKSSFASLGGDSWSLAAAEVSTVSRPLTTVSTPPEPHYFSYIQQTAPVLTSSLLGASASAATAGHNNQHHRLGESMSAINGVSSGGGAVRNVYHQTTTGPISPRPPSGAVGISFPRVVNVSTVGSVDSGTIDLRSCDSPQPVMRKQVHSSPRVNMKATVKVDNVVVNHNMFENVVNVQFYK
jgi:hypothetical protein